MEDLLVAELQALGATHTRVTRAGVEFGSTLEIAYRACIFSRLANRVLLPLVQAEVTTPEALYDLARTVAWDAHLSVDHTFAVDAAGQHDTLTHSHYVALRVKDAIVDHFRERHGSRPNVDPQSPDVRIHVHLQRTGSHVGLSIDLAGHSLHRRGYRPEGAAAPLKENLAAAILMRSGWPQATPLVDPMCGSGTLLIEAAAMSGRIAPGLWRYRASPAPMAAWPQHDRALWQTLLQQARDEAAAGRANIPPIIGHDISRRHVEVALNNIERAGLGDHIEVSVCTIDACQAPQTDVPGHVVVNPPYGERLGEQAEMFNLYARLGQTLKERFAGWQAHVFTQDPELGKATGLRATKRHQLFNGTLACQLLHIPLFAASDRPARQDGGRTAFANRLHKNLAKLRPWAKSHNVSCYRVYDADLPEYAVAIDVYEHYVQVQEYQAPRSIDPGRAQARLRDVMLAVPEVLGVEPKHVFLKVRKRQRGSDQYTKQDEAGRFYRVQEGRCVYYVNFTDYLDTGLFLDHRPLRSKLAKDFPGRRFLNLFGYTGTATVAAAHGGAAYTTTVDMSRTYLEWTERNLNANGFEAYDHELVQANVMDWLQDAPAQHYDVILLDPPTFSNSKRMDNTFDVQRDHVPLLRDTYRLLAPGGKLYFSNNAQRFKLEALPFCAPQDITEKTIPQDFKRSKPHRCWLIRRPA